MITENRQEGGGLRENIKGTELRSVRKQEQY